MMVAGDDHPIRRDRRKRSELFRLAGLGGILLALASGGAAENQSGKTVGDGADSHPMHAIFSHA